MKKYKKSATFYGNFEAKVDEIYDCYIFDVFNYLRFNVRKK